MELDLLMEILFDLGNKFGNLFIFAYILTRVKAFRRIISKEQLSFKDQLVLSVIFGIFGIVGTYFSFEYNGALVNTRIIGVASGGLFGGPIVGLLSGLIAGVHRGMINTGNVTSTACAISTVLEGLMAGFMGLYVRNKVNKWRYAVVTGVIGESMRKIALLIIVKPLSVAVELVKDIWIPMVVINSIGLALFFMILESIFRDRERLQAQSAQLSLKIVDEALPYLRTGFESDEFRKVAQIIHDMTDFDAVTLTDRERIIAHIGDGTPRHEIGKPIVTYLTESVFKSKTSKIMDTCYELDCEYMDTCNLKSTLTLPLSNGNSIIGTLKLYKKTEHAISEFDVELGEGLAKLIATELKISKLERKEKLLQKAEYKALQAQINPHFLFNSLTVIGSICRTEPAKARELIYSLSKHFRKNLNNSNDLVSIYDEIEHVKAYVSIEKARLDDDLEIIYNFDDSMDLSIPPLTLQPMVENAIKHGIYPKRGKGTIRFDICFEDGAYIIKISDDGVGMDVNVMNDIISGKKIKGDSYGTKNVIERLKSAFGDLFSLEIHSQNMQGTEIIFKIKKEVAYV